MTKMQLMQRAVEQAKKKLGDGQARRAQQKAQNDQARALARMEASWG